MVRPLALAVAGLAFASQAAFAAPAWCPKGGLNYGVIPYDSSAAFVPMYHKLGNLIEAATGCKVNVLIGNNYTATIEAMRAKKIDAGELGPLSYVLAHAVAGVVAIATYSNREGQPDTYTASVVTWPGSGITTLKGVAGHTFAYSDPASTSGHLFPAYALAKAGIDPDHGVKAIYAGSHTSSFEALLHHKVEAGEMNSSEISSAKAAGIYKASDFVTLWTSAPIPQDPIVVRSDLPEPLKTNLTSALQHLSLAPLTQKELDVVGVSGRTYVPQSDAAYNGIRDLISVLHIDLNKLNQ